MFEGFFGFIAQPLGVILNWIYENIAFHNYGVAIIIFTLIIKCALLPLMIKQQKSSREMQKIQPKLKEMQKMYKNDPQKLHAETLRLYQENGVNPGAGCLPALLQMPILLSLYYVVSKPLTFMKGMSASKIASLAAEISGKSMNTYYKELIIVSHNKILNMNFLGLDLSKIPDFNKIFNGNNRTEYLALLILPILATVTIYFSSKINMKNMSEMGQTESSGKVMMYLPIVMTALFSFKVPAGLAIYWIVDNLFRIGQQIYINKCVMVDD